MHPHKSHLVFYQLEDQGILIIRIRHAHENWMNDLEAGG
jgi:toxin ParE1/3/4